MTITKRQRALIIAAAAVVIVVVAAVVISRRPKSGQPQTPGTGFHILPPDPRDTPN